MKKRAFLIFSAIVILACVSFSVCACADKPDVVNGGYTMLRTSGKDIVNVAGDSVKLRGTNAGGWLVQESWMCPTDLACQGEMMAILEERFGHDGMRELLKIYEDNWWKEEDFDNVVSLGMNVIRLPFTYMNLVDGGEFYEPGFERLDWFVRECAERELYVILDMHGAYGSQNGNDHSGNLTYDLYGNAENMAKTEEVWKEVARRFKGNSAVAGYDLLNEPLSEKSGGKSEKAQWDYFDRLYKSIRAIDSEHIIFLMGCWDADAFPAPEEYGWENIVYEFHNYNWGGQNNILSQRFFIADKIRQYKSLTVPALVGEFTMFDKKESWEYALSNYSGDGINWTTWTYKVVADGVSNWGLYCGNPEKVDLNEDSYEEIARKWSAVSTADFSENEMLCGLIREFCLAEQ